MKSSSWPQILDCKDYGILYRVHPNSDEDWYCQYQRKQDGKYFNIGTLDGDAIKSGKFTGYFMSCDLIKTESWNLI